MERAYGLDIPRSLDELCDSRRTALIVYDMQVGIVSQIADRARIIQGVIDVIEAARDGGFRVIFTRPEVDKVMLHLSIVQRVSIGQVDFQDQQRDRNCEDAIAKCLKTAFVHGLMLALPRLRRDARADR